MKKEPLISIIVPTFNSSRTIEKCLKSIKNQSYKNIEIIVIDNNSSDKTLKIAQKHTNLTFTKWSERVAQKNFWIKKSSWKYLCLIDSDMYMDEHLIRDCFMKIEEDDNNGWVCIPVKDIWSSFWVKVIAFERTFYKWTQIEAARFLRKDLVEKVWWYENIIFYEEFIVPQKIAKLGYNIKIHTQFAVHHDYDDFTFFMNLKKKYYYWKSLREYQKQMEKLWLTTDSSWQTSVINRYLIFFKNINFYKKPILAISVLILKTLEFKAGFCWIVADKLTKKV